MNRSMQLAADARERSAGSTGLAARPTARASVHGIANAAAGQIRSDVEEVDRGGLLTVRIGGYASLTEHSYLMHDLYGDYEEVITRGAFRSTLLADPLTEFIVNHGAGGKLPMAHTRNGTLDLIEDDNGLNYDAFVDPSRNDVSDLISALKRKDVQEASFKFRITSGQWSPDWSVYRIDVIDLHRGDVSAVNFGANPDATSELRGPAGIDRADDRDALASLLALSVY